MMQDAIEHAKHHLHTGGYLLGQIEQYRREGVPDCDGNPQLLPPVLVQAMATEASAHISLGMGYLLIGQAEEFALLDKLGGG